MTKIELAREVAVSENLTLYTAVAAIDGITRVIKQQLAAGQDVTIRGFGTFRRTTCKERPGRNINTGEAIVIPEHYAAKFVSSKDLVSLLNHDKASDQ